MIHETVHCFGPGDILTGIFTQPVNDQSAHCVVILNAGLLHRVGPYRMFVDLGREIAQRGLPVFRFDLSGLGDSVARDDSKSEREHVIADIHATLDYLQTRHGYRHFTLMGLCSGADNAHVAAISDSRITGAVLMDGPGYPNFNSYIAHYRPRLLKLKTWVGAAKRMPGIGNRGALKEPVREEMFVRPFPPRQQMEQEIRGLCERGAKLLYLYTGGVETYFNHRSQFGENFPSLQFNQPGAPIEYEYNEKFDHTYSDPRDRKWLFERVLKWLLNVTGAQTPSMAINAPEKRSAPAAGEPATRDRRTG